MLVLKDQLTAALEMHHLTENKTSIQVKKYTIHKIHLLLILNRTLTNLVQSLNQKLNKDGLRTQMNDQILFLVNQIQGKLPN
jgi:hypothetical protein